MNRDAKTQSALIALARARRMRRALAHAHLHRNDPIPTLASSLGFMMTTARIADESPPASHAMEVIGVSPSERVAYLAEDLGAHEAPLVFRLWLHGPRQGCAVPLRAWYEQDDHPIAIRARIAELADRLLPVTRTTTEAWMLSTRIIARRAVTLDEARPGTALPIRKFALQLVIDPVSGTGTSGHTTVTAFHQPNAKLIDVWAVPGEDSALARVSFTGIPRSRGLCKEAMILLTSGC